MPSASLIVKRATDNPALILSPSEITRSGKFGPVKVNENDSIKENPAVRSST